MNKLKLITLLTILLIASTASTKVLTLDESIDIALHNNKNLQLAEQELENAKGQIKEAWGGALPQISMESGMLYTENKPTMNLLNYDDPQGSPPITLEVGERDNYFTNITIIQPIWVGGKVGAALDGAKLYNQYAQHNFKNAEEMVVYGTKLSFYSVLLAKESVAVAQEAVDLAQDHAENVSLFYEQGVAAKFDKLRAEVAVANAKPNLIKAQNGVELALNNFKSTLGIDLKDDVEIDGQLIFDPFEIDYETALNLAFENREDWKAIDYQIKGQEKLVRITKGDYYPSLLLVGKYEGFQNGMKDDSEWSKDLSGSLVLNWSLGYGTLGRIKQQKAKLSQATILKRQLKDQIALEVKQAILNLEEAQNIIKSQEKTVEQAEESYRISEARYESGTGTELEVSDARLALNVAKMNYVKALFDYSVAKTTLEKTTGTLK